MESLFMGACRVVMVFNFPLPTVPHSAVCLTIKPRVPRATLRRPKPKEKHGSMTSIYRTKNFTIKTI